MSDNIRRSAIISNCGTYRYLLSRDWDDTLPRAAYIMLNPSTADAYEDDPTIRKCTTFAKQEGMGGFDVVNLFAYRATKPKDLRANGWQRGPENDLHIEHAARRAAAVVCAWGANARGLVRAGELLSMLKQWDIEPVALRLLSDGTPEHPLMLPYACRYVSLRATRSPASGAS